MQKVSGVKCFASLMKACIEFNDLRLGVKLLCSHNSLKSFLCRLRLVFHAVVGVVLAQVLMEVLLI